MDSIDGQRHEIKVWIFMPQIDWSAEIKPSQIVMISYH